ncbi:MAG: M23 family metallopeptidase [Alphaproteobacteria bacterium]|nr:M23 family metallopeptidase [Alphaproteobacteria bacterium]
MAARLALLAEIVLLVTGCSQRPDGPAPVLSRDAAPATPQSVEVQRGQTLSGIAHAHHIPMRVLAEANQLTPPYHIQAGQTLIIPSAGQPATQQVSPAPPPSAPSEPTSIATSPQAVVPHQTTAAPAEQTPPVPAAPTPIVSSPAPADSGKTVASVPAAKTERPAVSAQNGGMFLWPVHGRVLAGYCSGPDGTHNDGINIAAPRGAPVEAVDAGVVAYAGNELRGYGNLLLVKHPNGWISAYAHCDQVLVKRGDKVSRGQIIARVGSTGNVSEPQLHFELRRGNRAVDPREFLSPQPTATSPERSSPS